MCSGFIFNEIFISLHLFKAIHIKYLLQKLLLMKSLRHLSTLLLIIFFSTGALVSKQSNSVLKQIGGTSTISSYSPEHDLGKNIKIVGSPLFKGEFTPGKIIFSGETVSETAKLNYDTYTNQLVFEENGEYYVVPLSRVKGFYFLDSQGNRSEAFLSGFENKKEGIEPSTFMEVLYNGEVKLFNYHYTIYRKDEANIYNPRETDYYNSKSKYLILDNNGELKEIKLKKKDLFKVLSNNKNQLDTFTKENGLNLGNIEDVKKLLSYYDTLNMK